MLVKNKFKITKSFIAALEVIIDNENDKSEKEYFKKSLNFINSTKDSDVSGLSNNQKNWLVSISQKIRKNGFSI